MHTYKQFCFIYVDTSVYRGALCTLAVSTSSVLRTPSYPFPTALRTSNSLSLHALVDIHFLIASHFSMLITYFTQPYSSY